MAFSPTTSSQVFATSLVFLPFSACRPWRITTLVAAWSSYLLCIWYFPWSSLVFCSWSCPCVTTDTVWQYCFLPFLAGCTRSSLISVSSWITRRARWSWFYAGLKLPLGGWPCTLWNGWRLFGGWKISSVPPPTHTQVRWCRIAWTDSSALAPQRNCPRRYSWDLVL